MCVTTVGGALPNEFTPPPLGRKDVGMLIGRAAAALRLALDDQRVDQRPDGVRVADRLQRLGGVADDLIIRTFQSANVRPRDARPTRLIKYSKAWKRVSSSGSESDNSTSALTAAA